MTYVFEKINLANKCIQTDHTRRSFLALGVTADASDSLKSRAILGYRLLLRASPSHGLIAGRSAKTGYQVVRAAPLIPSTNQFVPGLILAAQQQALGIRIEVSECYVSFHLNYL